MHRPPRRTQTTADQVLKWYAIFAGIGLVLAIGVVLIALQLPQWTAVLAAGLATASVLLALLAWGMSRARH